MADVTKKPWGYLVGGTATTSGTITGEIIVKRMILTANDSADTITITDADGGVLVDWVAPPECVTVVEVGARINGLVIDPSATDDYVSVIVE